MNVSEAEAVPPGLVMVRDDSIRSFLPQQLRWVYRQSAARGDPGGDNAYQHHGYDGAGQDQRVARRGLVDKMREQTAGNHSQKQAENRTAEQQQQRTQERGAHQLRATRAQRYTYAKLLQPLRNRIG